MISIPFSINQFNCQGSSNIVEVIGNFHSLHTSFSPQRPCCGETRSGARMEEHGEENIDRPKGAAAAVGKKTSDGGTEAQKESAWESTSMLK